MSYLPHRYSDIRSARGNGNNLRINVCIPSTELDRKSIAHAHGYAIANRYAIANAMS